MTTTARVSELPQLVESHSVHLIGDSGGRSLITGEVYESGVHAGMSAIETEHGTIYLETNHTIEIELDAGNVEPQALRYGWTDFEPDFSTDAIPGKQILTITDDDEEIAVIVHRTVDTAHDERLMEAKRARAQLIVDALNAADRRSVVNP